MHTRGEIKNRLYCEKNAQIELSLHLAKKKESASVSIYMNKCDVEVRVSPDCKTYRGWPSAD
jgi:hypothetical protein